jgi:hypothetical protein
MTGSLGFIHPSTSLTLMNSGLSIEGIPSFGGPQDNISPKSIELIEKAVENSCAAFIGAP